MYVGGGQLLVEIVICDTTSTGTSQHEMSIIDGRGGKVNLGLTLVVAEELVDGGSIQWSPETGDRDNDGVDDSVDAFPNDPAASIDSDGDGYPDAWNGEASEEQIAGSSLVIDAFPNDPTEWIDADGDGVGANTDLDDQNPRIGATPDAVMTVTDGAIEVGATGTIFLEVSSVDGLNALDASFGFDPAYLELVSVQPTELLDGWIFDSFSPEPGVVNIATTTTGDYSGDGQLIALEFRLIQGSVNPIPVTLMLTVSTECA